MSNPRLIAERLAQVEGKIARIDKRRHRSMMNGLFDEVTPEEQELVRYRTNLRRMALDAGLELAYVNVA